MDVRVPYMVQDPSTALRAELKPTEGLILKKEPFFLDGPVTRRVAILDFDETTGELHPGARFVPPPPGKKRGKFEIKDETNFTARDFMQVSVFATVLNTMYMFEEEDTLGRELQWAFDAPQLLVVPRAGERANAFYERASHSLQFFSFPGKEPKSRIFTALSHDIVAHETGHAILDGIAPDLYNSITPQSLALHEAIADLTALIMAFRGSELSDKLLRHSGGSIGESSTFAWLAEEFGAARDTTGRTSYLRSLWNEKNLNPNDNSLDQLNQRNNVDRAEPHLLSQVLTGALYRVVWRLHEEYKRRLKVQTGQSELSVSGKALFMAREHFKRLIFRALDYLPPGEVSFADYGRAILSADKASHPEDSLGRNELGKEFLRRYIARKPEELAVKTDFADPAVGDLDLRTLLASDWAAYDFANRNRELLHIPEGIHFHVRPRLKVAKKYYTAAGPKTVQECIFKVSWERDEPNPPGSSLPPNRQITVGTTLAIDWETRRVRALLPSHAAVPMEESGQQVTDRDDMLRRLLAADHLHIAGEGEEEELSGGQAIVAESTGSRMRIRGSGRMLHIVG